MKNKFKLNTIKANKILGGKEREYQTKVNVPEMDNNGASVTDIHHDDNNNGIIDANERVCAK